MRDVGVDVWCLRLSDATANPALADVLSSSENVRAASFHAEPHRQKFVTCRGVLRFLLGHYVGSEPRGVELEYGPHGKPFVTHSSRLQFNIAHSGDLALFAFSDLDVGIDIEKFRPITDVMGIARRFFCAEEAADLAVLSGEERTQTFHVCWARKEAYIKALGEGLSHSLENFQVSVLPNEPPRLKGLESEWLLRDLRVAPDYAAALAVRSTAIHLWVGPVLSAEEFLLALEARPI